jgi:hypothetical protein
MAVNAAGQSTRPECFVELPVFDAVGNRVPFEIVDVRADEVGPSLLGATSKEPRATVEGERLYFPKSWLARSLFHITLRARNGRSFKTPIELSSCEQRTSLETGETDTGYDAGVSRINGRISGCQVDKDWWVRAMPMFGGQNRLAVYEGVVRSADNSFSISASLRGERHILVIGRTKQPLLAVGVDATSGGATTDIGVLDMSKVCQK